ncbi:MAG: hypothetical protein Q8R92_08255, partial [Deltaproteobacteria bacterium]|nr:hypothetical protein [Deltaproteobacteria bacterium]
LPGSGDSSFSVVAEARYELEKRIRKRRSAGQNALWSNVAQSLIISLCMANCQLGSHGEIE